MVVELATGLTSTDDERLAQAESVVRAWCGWHIAPERTDTVVFDTMASGVLILPTLHLVDVVSVELDGTAVDPTTYDWTPEGVLRRTGYRMWLGTDYTSSRVTVEFTHGYATPPPAVTAVVQALANRAVDNPGSLVRTQVGPYSNTYSQTASNQVVPMALLDAERNVLAAHQLPKRP